MSVLHSAISAGSEQYVANREGLLALLAAHEVELDKARAGGGARYVERHRARGRLPVRERIELLLDQDSPFLELSPLAAWGIGVPRGRESSSPASAWCRAWSA